MSLDWQSGGLATSNDAETATIAGGFSHLCDHVNIDNFKEIHIFLNSINAIWQVLDASPHSAQLSALELLFNLRPWMESKTTTSIVLHHVPDSVDYVFEPHREAHNLATSTKVECRAHALRTLEFNRVQITDDALKDWDDLFSHSTKYVGQNFLYPHWAASRKDHSRAKRMKPSHLNGGTWLKSTGHSLSFTAQMVRGLTAHAPIGHYRHCFKVGDQVEACTCDSRTPETNCHVFYTCKKHPIRPPDMPTSSIDSPFWDFFGKFIMDNPCAYAFKEDPEITKTPDVSTWQRGRWAKDPPSTAP